LLRKRERVNQGGERDNERSLCALLDAIELADRDPDERSFTLVEAAWNHVKYAEGASDEGD
jgi:hypothetical protein